MLGLLNILKVENQIVFKNKKLVRFLFFLLCNTIYKRLIFQN